VCSAHRTHLSALALLSSLTLAFGRPADQRGLLCLRKRLKCRQSLITRVRRDRGNKNAFIRPVQQIEPQQFAIVPVTIQRTLGRAQPLDEPTGAAFPRIC